ncbi:type IV pili methyl-accepting chemotaxis transducer N-terminal domain-containing protein [Variovorax terrae]|uniref:Type IV pili methyl-accepting chemotaxis transducer N-terminal domain-containing protein n=1 Tax=Variovorax terrae TaxID=2923278 RepID=A0A9X1VXS6_9BURK|nr:type IV pili methyl-accepting chemotaxis transducer N-terminal domain-containing protein [Variovorax terrae]MCJ0762503.1 type IV pili methyl-accepting chemotaxis transducer N-terminal domain-containing protein [Variovorax terrae]
MKRRTLLIASACAALPLAAQVADVNDAINKAGRQRMLSQRMGKAYLAVVQEVEVSSARAVLDRSMALFDRQLAELKGFAPTPELRDTYGRLELAWSDLKASLVGAQPSRNGASQVIQNDARVLALANQGTVQYEQLSGQPLGRLVNIAGRQRMLSQRMAKFYMAGAMQVEPQLAAAELAKARSEFLTAMQTLRSAPEATARIRDELALADGQWVFFDLALQRPQASTVHARALSDVFVSSENLLTIMDRVTGLYANLKA